MLPRTTKSGVAFPFWGEPRPHPWSGWGMGCRGDPQPTLEESRVTESWFTPITQEETEPEMLGHLLSSRRIRASSGTGQSLPITGSLAGAQLLPRRHHRHLSNVPLPLQGAWDGGAKVPLHSDCGCQGISQEEPEYRVPPPPPPPLVQSSGVVSLGRPERLGSWERS